MKKLINKCFAILFLGSLVACGTSSGGGDDTPPTPTNTAPSSASLVFPNSQLCTDANVDFQWNSASDTDGDPISYTVTVATNSAFTTGVITRTTTSTSIEIELTQGNLYYWKVSASDGQDSTESSSSSFNTAGTAVENYLPYAATLVAPTADQAAGTVSLEWSASDEDGDALTYTVYHAEAGSSLTAVETDIAATSSSQTVAAGNYQWRVDVSDGNGITQGQVWTYSVN